MAQQTIVTTPHNSGLGDPAFTAFEKCNAMFTDLYGGVGGTTFNAGNTGTAPVPNFLNGAVQTWTQNANVTWGVPLNVPSVGQQLTLIVTQDNIGAHSTAWNAIYKNVPKTPASSVAASKQTYIFIWNGSYWSVPDNYVNTPFPYGAVGDGVTNDTAAVQAAVNAGNCFLPAGFTFLVTTTITVPSNSTLQGEGIGLSIIKGSGVVGPVVAVGPAVTVNNLIANFQISGTATIGLQGTAASEQLVSNVWCSGTFTYAGFFFDNSYFSSVLNDLTTFNANIGGTITLSASPSGLTTQTITGANPGNGNYMMIFSTGELRRVVISGSGATFPTQGSGGTATWTGAVTASGTSVAYGIGFFLGGGFNANACNGMVTQGTFFPFDFVLDDTNVLGTSRGNTFNAMTAQGGQVGVFMGKNWFCCTFNSFYTENVVAPIVFGNVASSLSPTAMQFNAPTLVGPKNTNPGYANRVAWIQAENGRGLKVITPQFVVDDASSIAAYPIVFTGGTFSHAAVAYAFANVAGVIKGVALIYPGDYTVAPTGFSVTATPGSGATFSITTGTSPLNSTATAAVLQVNVTAGGSGYTGGIGMVPVLLNVAIGTSVDSAMFPWGQGGGIAGIGSILCYQSVNGSGNSEYGLSLINDNTLFASTGGWMSGNNVVKAPENVAREWMVYVNQSGTNSTMAVPIVLFP